jgi:hypothetical protein
MNSRVCVFLLVAGSCLTLALPLAAQDKNLAPTPPMGWSISAGQRAGWNQMIHFAIEVSRRHAGPSYALSVGDEP